MRKLFSSLGILLFGAVMAWAAGPMPDTFFVHFNDPVVVNKDLTLPPGNYKFQRITNPTDPAVFTIINGDNGKVIGTTPPADLAPNGGDASITRKGVLVLDQVGGKDYLDSVNLQGMGHGFMFQQPDNARAKLNSGGKKLEIPVQTGGQE